MHVLLPWFWKLPLPKQKAYIAYKIWKYVDFLKIVPILVIGYLKIAKGNKCYPRLRTMIHFGNFRSNIPAWVLISEATILSQFWINQQYLYNNPYNIGILRKRFNYCCKIVVKRGNILQELSDKRCQNWLQCHSADSFIS